MSATPDPETTKSSNKAGIIIALLAIIVIVQSVKIYQIGRASCRERV